MTLLRSRVLPLALMSLLAACGSGESVFVPAGSTITIDGGNAQQIAVGTATGTALSVVVRDANGTTLAAVPVLWSITSGGGSVSPVSTTTDANGVASTVYTSGTTSGPKVIAATVSGAAGSPIAFTVQAVPGPAARLVLSGGNAQSGGIGTPLAQPLSVTVVDQYGNGVSGVTVQFAATVGGGSVNPPSRISDVNGLATTAYTPAAIGAGTVTATAAGLIGSPVSFTEAGASGIQLVREIGVVANYGLHDQFVRGGLAFLNIWNDGLHIYDVGDGRAGGTPANPVFIGRITTAANGVPGGAQVHNSWWYWPPNGGAKRYVFVGQEGPSSGLSNASGDIHVVDITNPASPTEVAFFNLPGAGAHNFWVDETNEILYAAYYNGGVVALNISGTLSGNLQARMLANVRPGGAGNTFTWGVMLYNNSLYASDMLSGLWQLRLNSGSFQVLSGGNNVSERYSSDLWIANGFAYTGTWGNRGRPGNALKVWQLNGTGAPVLVDSIIVAGVGTVSDVEVSADGRMLMLSAENGQGAGIWFYSLVNNPARPELITNYVVGTGVHTTTFAEINGRRYVFAARNPGSPSLLILDVTSINP